MVSGTIGHIGSTVLYRIDEWPNRYVFIWYVMVRLHLFWLTMLKKWFILIHAQLMTFHSNLLDESTLKNTKRDDITGKTLDALVYCSCFNYTLNLFPWSLLTQMSRDCLWAVPVLWRLIKLPPAAGWGPGTLTSADPAAGYCSRELPPEPWVTAPAPGSPAAACPSSYKHTHTHIKQLLFLNLLSRFQMFVSSLCRHERTSYLWREFTFSCSCKLASWTDSFISTDDLSCFVWLSICLCRM